MVTSSFRLQLYRKNKLMPNPSSHSIRALWCALCHRAGMSSTEERWRSSSSNKIITTKTGGKPYVNHESLGNEGEMKITEEIPSAYTQLQVVCIPRKDLSSTRGWNYRGVLFSKERKPPKGDQSFPFTFFKKANRINKCALLKFN